MERVSGDSVDYTRFEEARIIGARALQLAMGAPPLVKPGKDATSLSLATKEYDENKIPITVVRD